MKTKLTALRNRRQQPATNEELYRQYLRAFEQLYMQMQGAHCISNGSSYFDQTFAMRTWPVYAFFRVLLHLGLHTFYFTEIFRSVDC